jgi:hypothetical protein
MDDSDPEILEYYDFYGSKPGNFLCLVAGTHGNEPAGSVFLYDFVLFLKKNPDFLKRGKLRIIPAVNKWGLMRDIRYNNDHFGVLPKSDINRNYTEEGGTEPISQNVVDLVNGANLVMDFHEGWGYHRCQKSSIGSSLTPTSYGPAMKISDSIVGKINDNINQSCKLFSSMPGKSCEISSTLGCHMQKNKLPYILMETTGQNNIQNISVRTNQVKIAVLTALDSLNFI